jgi:hypothetical protein
LLTSPCVSTTGAAPTTPSVRRTRWSAFRQSGIARSPPTVSTRMSGLPTRIFSRRSFCSPFITPMMTMSALTPTSTPPIAMTLISDTRRELRRLRR